MPAPHAHDYDLAAPYLHVLSSGMWDSLRPRLVAALAGAPRDGHAVDLGAGSGLATEILLRALQDAPVLAVEPSASLRGVLLGRLHGPDTVDRLTVVPAGAGEVELPASLSAVVAMNMIGHLDPEARARLWAAVAPRLLPGAPLVVNAQWPSEAVDVAPMTMEVRQGEAVYGVTVQARPTAADRILWTMDYSTYQGDRVLDEARTTYDWWIVTVGDLAAELRSAGLDVAVDDDLIVARGRS